jgi:hypothetical protein
VERLSAQDALAAMGYAPGQAPGWLVAKVEAAVDPVRRAARPASASRRAPVCVADGRILVGEGGILDSALLRRVLTPCTHVIAFVATLGPKVDRLVGEAEDLLDAYVLDTLSVCAAEAVAEAAEVDLAADLTPGEGVTLRYSPGYCDWPLEGQALVFDLLGRESAGVRLSASFLMQPRKSLTGIVGVGPDALVSPVENACAFCHKEDCDNRRS